MDSKRKAEEGEGDSNSYSLTLTNPHKKPHTLSCSQECTKSRHLVCPPCVILQNIPESLFDDEPINLEWLEQSLTTLDISYKNVVGVNAGLDKFSYGIIEFQEGDAGLKSALMLECRFKLKCKSRTKWICEPPEDRKGLYLWATSEQDMIYVREYVENAHAVEVAKECLEGACKEAYEAGGNFVEVIVQAMEFYEHDLI